MTRGLHKGGQPGSGLNDVLLALASLLSLAISALSSSRKMISNLESRAAGRFMFSWGFSLALYLP